VGHGDDGAIRFNVPEGPTSLTDLVHGPIDFDNEHIEKLVICGRGEGLSRDRERAICSTLG
jgi:glutamyl/glutaminyl-tRNA synthetase